MRTTHNNFAASFLCRDIEETIAKPRELGATLKADDEHHKIAIRHSVGCPGEITVALAVM
jgi:hypothetical protein